MSLKVVLAALTLSAPVGLQASGECIHVDGGNFDRSPDSVLVTLHQPRCFQSPQMLPLAAR